MTSAGGPCTEAQLREALHRVERRPDSGDGRSRRIVLTRAGAEVVRAFGRP